MTASCPLRVQISAHTHADFYFPMRSCLGILTMQTYSYFKRYPHDKPFYKLLVRRVACCHSLLNTSLTPRCSRLLGGFAMVRVARVRYRGQMLTDAVIRALEFADQALIAHAVYTYLITCV